MKNLKKNIIKASTVWLGVMGLEVAWWLTGWEVEPQEIGGGL